MRTLLWLLAVVWAVGLAAWWIRACLRKDCDEAGSVADWFEYEDALGDDG